MTELKLYIFDKLSSYIFCCLSDVRHRCHLTKSSLFPIYTGIKALLTDSVPTNRVTHSILSLVHIYVHDQGGKRWLPRCAQRSNSSRLQFKVFQISCTLPPLPHLIKTLFRDEDGMTPTLWAAFEGNLEALRLLVGRG